MLKLLTYFYLFSPHISLGNWTVNNAVNLSKPIKVKNKIKIEYEQQPPTHFSEANNI